MTDDEMRSAYKNHIRVKSKDSDYTFNGFLVTVFPKRGGLMRCVVENDEGICLIHSAKRLEKCE